MDDPVVQIWWEKLQQAYIKQNCLKEVQKEKEEKIK